VVLSTNPFREELGTEFTDAAPLIALEGMVSHQSSGRRATRVAVYGVDSRFWRFHQRAPLQLSSTESAISEALASDLRAAAGDAVILRIEKPSSIPGESLFGRKEDAAVTVRFTVKHVLGSAQLGEFSVGAHQGAVRTIFVPLKRLQSEMGLGDRVNTVLLGPAAHDPEKTIRERFELEDLGVRIRWIGSSGTLMVSTSSGIMPQNLAETVERVARELSFEVLPVLTYLANAIRVGNRETPYSLVAALDLRALPVSRTVELPPEAIVLNEWAARDLDAQPGDPVELDYYLWAPDGGLVTRSATFRLAAITRIDGLAAERDLVPEYPGITDSSTVSDWDPPFPLDLGRIRSKDEDYWERYRTVPKAFVWLDTGQELWKSRFGHLTGVRLIPPPGVRAGDRTVEYERHLRAALDPLENGLLVVPVRAQNLEASQGATDFSEYFVYFSFFLLVSAVLLAGLFFRLGIEQRLTQIGLLEATGIPWRQIVWIFRIEGLTLVAFGSLLGAVGSLAWSALVLHALQTWWIDAVGTRRLDLAVTPEGVLMGALAGMLVSWFAVSVTLRGLRQTTPRGLLAGMGPVSMRLAPGRRSRSSVLLVVACGGALTILAASTAAVISEAAGFFAAGALLLIAALAALRTWLDRSLNAPLDGGGPAAGWRFAFRNASARPGRTVLSAALIAFATFLIVSVQSFRRDENAATLDPRSGAGGYPLIAESVRPVYYNLNDEEGRRNLNLDSLADVKFTAFRLRPGDDASCLNLFQPQNPRVLGAPDHFLEAGRFSFSEMLAETAEERNNPWLLLHRRLEDGVLPAIADANSLTYVLHKKLGEDLEIPSDSGLRVRLRIVAALSDSIFQSELIVAESRFVQAFPRQPGWRVFLIEAPEQKLGELPGLLEESLRDYGFDIVTTAARLASFHRVENTYLSTFQSLGALGLLMGTVGLGAVLFRNVLERRRELALLEAVGWPRRSVRSLILRENLVLLLGGVTAGGLCALLAIAPVIARRGFTSEVLSVLWLLLGIAVSGYLACRAAARTAMRLPLVSSLRTE
jgi:ABC-type antimicrobial peptide transport system permease subunit